MNLFMHCYGKIFIVIFLDTKMDMKLIILGRRGQQRPGIGKNYPRSLKLFHLSAGEM